VFLTRFAHTAAGIWQTGKTCKIGSVSNTCSPESPLYMVFWLDIWCSDEPNLYCLQIIQL